MQWQDLMTRLAELVGRALANRWLADQSTEGRPEAKPVEPPIDENDVQESASRSYQNSIR